MAMIRAGIIGLGKMGISHCSIVNAHPDVDLVAVCDTSKLMLSAIDKYTSIKCFKDYRAMIDQSNLDCLIIATPTSLHAEISRYAMERNIHLFVEKPFCLRPEDGRELVELAARNDLVNQVGYHNRFIGVFQETKRLLERGIIGETYHILGEAYGQVVVKEKAATWRSSKTEGGGCLYDYAAHVIDLMNYFVGPPDQVAGTVLKKIYSKDVDDAVYSTLLYKNGKSAQLSVNWSDETYRKMSTQVEILGKRGKIIADRQECKVYLNDDSGGENMVSGWNMFYTTGLTEPVWFYLRGEEYSAQIDYFVRCIKEGRKDNINSFASALQTDIVIDLLQRDSVRKK
jgi:predicted dehydrogenase